MALLPPPPGWFEQVLASHAAAKIGPSELELSQAPMMTCWFAMRSARGNLALCGIGKGHPRLPDGFMSTAVQKSAMAAEQNQASW